MQKPSIPSGTRDFGPAEVVKRRYIFSTIEKVFVKYGFKPIETPAMENLSTLMGKYGDEGDKLLFKILNSGDFTSKVNDNDWVDKHANKLATQLAEKGLRYDLTVPFARFVVMNRNDITFPFRRYQMQPVWRADRPQKGRYREFYQCDADIIGSDSLVNEVDLVMIYAEAFKELGIDVTIKINNRKVLMGIAQLLGIGDRLTAFTVAIDKLDKIGMDGVKKELGENGLTPGQVTKAEEIIAFTGNNDATLDYLSGLFTSESEGAKGVDELKTVFKYLKSCKFDFTKLKIDLTLARGLNYYTGAILEVVANNVKMGSIGGGGRYDDLTGIFGLKDVSGVGISFGADRIYDVMEELNIFSENIQDSFTRVLFCCMTDDALAYALPMAAKVRKEGINAEVYPSAAKLKKQLDFANANKIPYAVIIGESEMETDRLTYKNMQNGEQLPLYLEEIIDDLKLGI
ncbi:MAG TPA: histidine--tRNA ligase [Bacteroidia bacterium]|nr:histidine--tRNA ligase [Bacteroidia bacterium]